MVGGLIGYCAGIIRSRVPGVRSSVLRPFGEIYPATYAEPLIPSFCRVDAGGDKGVGQCISDVTWSSTAIAEYDTRSREPPDGRPVLHIELRLDTRKRRYGSLTLAVVRCARRYAENCKSWFYSLIHVAAKREISLDRPVRWRLAGIRSLVLRQLGRFVSWQRLLVRNLPNTIRRARTRISVAIHLSSAELNRYTACRKLQGAIDKLLVKCVGPVRQWKVIKDQVCAWMNK